MDHQEDWTARPEPELLQNDKVAELKQHSEIKKALQQTAGAAPVSSLHVEKKQKLFLVTYLVSLVLLAGLDRVDDTVAEYNIRRVLKLISAGLIGLIVISVLFVNWYAAVVSLGVFSVILGLALQTTFTSFIGWIYILLRSPYRVGDRIRLGDATGDVIDVSQV